MERCLPTELVPQPHSNTNGVRDQASDLIIVGLGSPHGDDQIGWLVAGEIARIVGPAVSVRSLTVPIDLVHEMDGFNRAVILDAVRGDAGAKRIRRWSWPSPEILRMRVSGTHAMGLAETLELTGSLGRLPSKIAVWGIEGECFAPGADLASSLRTAIPDFAREIITREISQIQTDV